MAIIINGTNGDDFDLFGTGKAETINGKDGNDYLFGGGGNDILNGGAGDDTMYGDSGTVRFNGGSGNDFFWVGSNRNVTFLEGAGGGSDSIHSLITLTLAGDRANIEGLELFGDNNVNATGNALNNFLAGNSGRNTLSGLGGNDRLGMDGEGNLVGLGGTDTTIGGPGNDLHIFDSKSDILKELSGGGNDTAGSSNRGIDLTSKQFVQIENATLFGNTDGLNLTGNTAKNKLTGNDGINILNGGGGKDSLFGMGGNDQFILSNNKVTSNIVELDGGDGDDTIVVEGGNLDLTGKGGGIFVSTESVQLVGNRTLTVTGNDVGKMSADGKLTVTSDGGGILLSSDTLTFLGNTTVGDNTFRVYGGEGGIEIHAQTGIDTSNLATVRTPFDGNNGFFVFGAANGDQAGGGLALGDFNGDGLLDIGMGARFHDGDPLFSPSNGAIHVIESRTRADFLSEIDGKSVVNDLSDAQGVFNFLGPNNNNQAGSSLVSGDFNNDGFDDFFAAGPGTGPGAIPPSGSMILGSGSPISFGLADIDGNNGVVVLSETTGIQFATTVGAGDINGDGADDLLITAPASKVGEEVQGKFFAVFGDSDTKLGDAEGIFDTGDIVPGDNGVVIAGGIVNAGIGRSLATGDLNNDGRDDIITTFVQDGKVNIVIAFGDSNGPTIASPADADGLNAVTFFTDVPTSFTGGVFVAAGDVNGDGKADLVVAQSNPDSNAPATDNGVIVLDGRDNTGWQAAHGAKLADVADFFAYDPSFAGGVSVALGDVDGDGNNDMVFGTPEVGSTSSAGPAGAVKIFRGGAENLEAVNGATNLGAMLDGFFGQTLLGLPGSRTGIRVAVGDLDGDGFAEVVAGASGNSTMPGGAGVFWGTNLANVVAFVGTADDDEFESTEAAQRVVTGRGNDTVTAGTDDSVDTGLGDDTVIIDGILKHASGGFGFDTLFMLGGLSPANQLAEGWDKLNINGQGDGVMSLLLNDVLRLPDDKKTLTIDGDAGDTLTVQDGVWTDGGISGDYHVYTSGDAVLHLKNTIGTVNITLAE